MPDTLNLFGTEYTNVAGIIAKDDNGVDLTFTRGVDGDNLEYGGAAIVGTAIVGTAVVG